MVFKIKLCGILIFICGTIFMIVSSAQYSSATRRLNARQKQINDKRMRENAQLANYQRKLVRKAGGGNFLIPQVSSSPMTDNGSSSLKSSAEIWGACYKQRYTVFLLVSIILAFTILLPSDKETCRKEEDPKKGPKT